MGAQIEWLGTVEAGILRLGKNFKEWGDPYSMAAIVVRLKADTVELMGANTYAFTVLLKYRKQVADELRPFGIKYVTWKRIKGRRIKEVTITIDGPLKYHSTTKVLK